MPDPLASTIRISLAEGYHLLRPNVGTAELENAVRLLSTCSPDVKPNVKKEEPEDTGVPPAQVIMKGLVLCRECELELVVPVM